MLGEVVFLENHAAAVSTSQIDSPKDITRTIKDQRGQSRQYWMWGTDNQKPKRIIDAIEKNVILPEIIDFKKRAMISGGLIYGPQRVTEYGPIIEPMVIPEIEELFERTNVLGWLDETAEDKVTFNNRATQYLCNMRREITAFQSVDASEVRLEKQVMEGRLKGMIRNAYLSANWDKAAPADMSVVPALDPLYDVAGQIQQGSEHRYLLFSRHLTRGEKYYRRSPVESLMDSSYLTIHGKYPIWKDKAMTHSLGVAWHIEINEEWLRWRYSDWDEIKDKERTERKKKLGTEFMESMQGELNAGKPVITTFKIENGVEIVGWKITPITHKHSADGSFLDDITTVNSMICFSQGVDPSSIGLGGKIGMGAGSGSDKRVAINQYLMLHQADQRDMLQDLQIVAKVNRYSEKHTPGKRFAFGLLNFQVATLDQPSETKTSQNPDENARG